MSRFGDDEIPEEQEKQLMALLEQACKVVGGKLAVFMVKTSDSIGTLVVGSREAKSNPEILGLIESSKLDIVEQIQAKRRERMEEGAGENTAAKALADAFKDILGNKPS